MLPKFINIHSSICVAILLVLTSCGGGGGTASSGGNSEPHSSAATNSSTSSSSSSDISVKKFEEVSRARGLVASFGYIKPTQSHHEHFCSGIAAGDVDVDGDLDLFVLGGDAGPNHLFINDGNAFFIDKSDSAGVAYLNGSSNSRFCGASLVDLDGDGLLDIFVGAIDDDKPKVFLNFGNLTFKDATVGSGLDQIQAMNTISASFADIDMDGDLDMFITHWGSARTIDNVNNTIASTDDLWRNDSTLGNIHFTNISHSSGITSTIVPKYGTPPRYATPAIEWTFTPTFAHLNKDIYPDLVTTSDYGNSRVYLNATRSPDSIYFSDHTDSNVIKDDSGMGSVVADFDNDGAQDWFVSAIYRNITSIGNKLYKNDGNGNFTDISRDAGITQAGWAWGACAADFNLDGLLDIIVTNGWNEGFEYDPTTLFINNDKMKFTEEAYSWNIYDPEEGRGIVCGDFDGDGLPDFIEATRNSQNAISFWRNASTQKKYLKVNLSGLSPNISAVGARIEVHTDRSTQYREVLAGNNFVSQNATEQIFGLGGATTINLVRVIWPDGHIQDLTNVNAGSLKIKYQ